MQAPSTLCSLRWSQSQSRSGGKVLEFFLLLQLKDSSAIFSSFDGVSPSFTTGAPQDVGRDFPSFLAYPLRLGFFKVHLSPPRDPIRLILNFGRFSESRGRSRSSKQNPLCATEIMEIPNYSKAIPSSPKKTAAWREPALWALGTWGAI